MATMRFIMGDQLSLGISCLQGCDKALDTVFMCEVFSEACYVKHHKKKLVFIFSAMRHFALELRQLGYKVHYSKLDDPQNSGSFTTELRRVCAQLGLTRVVVTHPGEYRVLQELQQLQQDEGLQLEIREDSRFLISADEFSRFAAGKGALRMEFFYRHMRQKYNILMQDGEPIGGEWNLDALNRKAAPRKLHIPPPYTCEIDDITREVLLLVAERFGDHFGDLQPFYLAVSRQQALEAFELFLQQRLALFGDYQDAMLSDQPWMYHAHIGFYLNCGLLEPLECILAVQQAYLQGKAPLNSCEGFIRQVLGWREYVRAIYWLKMPEYAELNFFAAQADLPQFYWTGQTDMNCLRQCVQQTAQLAYAHHIQRLMVLGNFALLAGVEPRQMCEWFLLVYADAFEWVELPNVVGMILFADGGYLASKPYAAGGGYINKMSDYCKNCRYNVQLKHGKHACPFNYLYWDFLQRNRHLLANNPRLALMYKAYDNMDEDKKQAMRSSSAIFLQALADKKVL